MVVTYSALVGRILRERRREKSAFHTANWKRTYCALKTNYIQLFSWEITHQTCKYKPCVELLSPSRAVQEHFPSASVLLSHSTGPVSSVRGGPPLHSGQASPLPPCPPHSRRPGPHPPGDTRNRRLRGGKSLEPAPHGPPPTPPPLHASAPSAQPLGRAAYPLRWRLGWWPLIPPPARSLSPLWRQSGSGRGEGRAAGRSAGPGKEERSGGGGVSRRHVAARPRRAPRPVGCRLNCSRGGPPPPLGLCEPRRYLKRVTLTCGLLVFRFLTDAASSHALLTQTCRFSPSSRCWGKWYLLKLGVNILKCLKIVFFFCCCSLGMKLRWKVSYGLLIPPAAARF